jgi:hypothetical protein
METRRKPGVQPQVIAEVSESQMGQMHAEILAADEARWNTDLFLSSFQLKKMFSSAHDSVRDFRG